MFGTSLSSTSRYDWPAHLETRLATCLNRRVTVTIIARPGATIAWAEGQIGRVRDTAPDLVLMEFAVNDADLWDGLPRAEARRRTGAVLEALAGGPGGTEDGPALALMTMNPAAGVRGLVRPFLGRHYADYRSLSRERDLGLVDLEAQWRALPRAARGLDDGLHPDPARARAVIVPTLLRWFGCP